MFNQISKHIILPFSDLITGWDVKKGLDFLGESQFWTKNQLKEYQNRELKKLINHAYSNVQYYKELFDNHGIKPEAILTINDLKKIPQLTKELIVQNFNNGKLIAKNINIGKVLLKQSSGSTGQKTIFYIDKKAYGFNIACNIRGWEWMGYQLGDKYIKVSQNRRNSLIKKAQDRSNRSYLFTNSYDQDGFKNFCSILHKIKPAYLRSYPDPLIFYANYIRENNISIPKIHGINTTGNTLSKEARELIEEVFNTNVFDSYSCEGGANFFECPTHSCYHGAMEYAVTEIIDENGNDANINETGFVVSTDLHNYAMPFIRYNSRDLVSKGGQCKCGRNHDTIKEIIGRENDVIITPVGQLLIAQTFTTYFKHFRTIEYFQINQTSSNNIIIKLKVTVDFIEEDKNRIIEYWKKYTKNSMKISIELLDNIDLLASGKRRFLIRDKNIKLPF